MTVNIKATSRKYHGRMAETYETKRKKQRRWHHENEIVSKMLRKLKPSSVLDVPVGTGRFLLVYDQLKVKDVTAVDISDTMLGIAKEKMKKVTSKMYVDFLCKDVRKVKGTFDVSVCIRFLDLIDEAAMHEVVTTLCKRTERAIICTIRFGDHYVPKSNTAEHDRQKFERLIRKLGWKIKRSEHEVFRQGWHVLLLTRR